MIGTSGYLAASGLVLVFVLLVGWTAARIRAASGLGHTPAVGLLVWCVLAIAIATVLALVLGAIGALGRWQLIGGALAICVAVELVFRRWSDTGGSSTEPIEFDRWAMAAAALVMMAWLGGTKAGWDGALLGFDTLTYHMPFALSFAFEDGLRHYTFVDVSYLHHFYPAGSELLHAIGLVLTGRDLLSVFLNFGFALIALLSAWCLGQRLGSARIGVMAVAPLMISAVMVRQQAGTASSDIGAVAMLLAAAAFVATALGEDSKPRGGQTAKWLALAGLAAGLAIGIKLTAGAPILVFSVWLAVVAWREPRVRPGFGLFLAGLILVGLPWELRNLILAGSPLPFIDEIGPIDLPSPARGFEGRSPFSVAHYVVNPSTNVLLDYFLPGLKKEFGWSWPLVLLLGLFGAIQTLTTGGSRNRAFASAALLGALAYLVTPFSAAGPDGFPVAFEWNLRYLAPALALALVLLAAWAGRLEPGSRTARYLPPGLLAIALLTATTADVIFAWKTLDGVWVAGAGLLAIVAVWLLMRFPRFSAVILVGALGSALFFIGLLDRARYLDRPTEETPSYYLGDLHLQAEAERLDGVKLGFTGQLAAFSQYRFRGADFATEASYIGVEEPHGGFRAVASCQELEQVIREKRIEIVAATPDRKSNSPLRYIVYARVASAHPLEQARFLSKYETYGLVSYYRVLPNRFGCRPPAGPAGED